MTKKLDELELNELAFNYLNGLKVSDLDEYIVSKIDTDNNRIIACKRYIIENITKQDWISVSFDLDNNSAQVLLRNEKINCETHHSCSSNTRINIGINGDKFTKGILVENFIDTDKVLTNSYSKAVTVPRNYSILDGYPEHNYTKIK